MKKRRKKENQKTAKWLTASASGQPARLTLCASAEFQDLVAREGEPQKRPTFTILAYTGGPMRVDGFYRPVVIDLARLALSQRTSVLLDHNRSQIVGQSTRVTKSNNEVNLDGLITGQNEATNEVLTQARNGFKWSTSVGVEIQKLESIAEKQTAKVNGRLFEGPLWIVRAGRLGEVSFVSVGADENAKAKIAATAAKETVMKFEEWLEAKGFAHDELTDEQRKTLEAAWKAEQSPKAKESQPEPPASNLPEQPPKITAGAPEGNGPDPVAEVRAAARQESERISKINKLFGDQHDELKAKAIGEGWSFERAENEYLKAENERIKAERPKLTIHSPSAPERTSLVVTAALCRSLGLSNIEKSFNEKTLEAADKLWRHGVGLQEVLLEAAAARGSDGTARRITAGNYESVMRALGSRPQRVEAGFSTYDITGILSNTANKFLLAAFNAVESTWRAIAARRSVNDFKTITSYRLTGNLEYQQVGPSGELKHGTLAEESFTNKADTYGTILAITRTDVINDDLGALNGVPTRLGRGGALKLNKVFWTAFMDNSTFFTSGRGNFADGAATALGIVALTTAETMFLNQTDADGDPLGIMPAILLTPNALFRTGEEIYAGKEIRDTTSSKKYPTANTFGGKFTVQRSSYLSNTGISGYSTKKWYLLANPAELATIEVAFLQGRETPVVEMADTDFNVLGIQMRGYHDFGVSKQEYRAGVAMKGEA